MAPLIHTGNLSYLNRVHRNYGVHRYWMKLLKRWPNGKTTVEFVERENEIRKTASGSDY